MGSFVTALVCIAFIGYLVGWPLFLLYAIRYGKPIYGTVVHYMDNPDNDKKGDETPIIKTYYPVFEYTDEYGAVQRVQLPHAEHSKNYGARTVYLFHGKMYQKEAVTTHLLTVAKLIIPIAIAVIIFKIHRSQR